MKIVKQESFNEALKEILIYIARDSKQSAKSFKSGLLKQINSLNHFPYKYRKSIYFNDEHIRDLIFKGYTIPYKIDEEKKQIIIIGIKKYRNSFY